MTRAIEVLDTGALALVQDLGRPGWAATGVGRSGAADRAALRLANRLVANPEGAAGIEVVFGGLVVRAHSLLTVALTGAPAPVDIDGTPVGPHAVLTLRPGQVVRLGMPPTGLRSYLAVRGGIAVEPVLGSRSTDVLAELGPPRLAAGTLLPIGPEPATSRSSTSPPFAPPGGTVLLHAVRGPRADYLGRPAGPAADHLDRLQPQRPGRDAAGRRAAAAARRPGSCPARAWSAGRIQIPPGGEPVLFLADHPVTGGYPVAAVVLDRDVDRAAQVRPGQQVRFTLLDPPWSP